MKIQRGFALVQGLILCSFSSMIVHLIQTGTIVLYISPKVIWLSEFSAILLFVIAIAKLVPMHHKHSATHSCCWHDHACVSDHHNHSYKTMASLQMAIFVIPLMLGFGMQPRVLASTALSNSINTAGPIPFYAMHIPTLDKFSSGVPWPSGLSFVKKDVDSSAVANGTKSASANMLNKSSSQNKPNSIKPLTPKSVNSIAKETDLMQLYLNIDDHPEQVYNQHWRLTGFVYKDPKLAKNQFVITRFVITCCIVDATPIGIMVESPDAPNLKADTWVEVDGLLQKRSIGGADEIKSVHNFHETDDGVPYLVVTSCKVVATPKDPYLAPPMQ
ncbi:MAG: TIGR03943 family protein [Desulfosporosinus sp.]|nr:TIGR03943 family protein [Desulfosporosinus sp.]